MNRLKLVLSSIGLVLILASLLLDMSLGRPELGRIVGWVAIAALMGAVAIRVIERRRGGSGRTGGQADRRSG
jgi:hypothetical protein